MGQANAVGPTSIECSFNYLDIGVGRQSQVMEEVWSTVHNARCKPTAEAEMSTAPWRYIVCVYSCYIDDRDTLTLYGGLAAAMP